MNRAKAIALFIRDLLAEAPAIWSLAHHRYCERTGGHRWSGQSYDSALRGWGQTCHRCGTWQAHPFQLWPATATGSSCSVTIGPSQGYGYGNTA